MNNKLHFDTDTAPDGRDHHCKKKRNMISEEPELDRIRDPSAP